MGGPIPMSAAQHLTRQFIESKANFNWKKSADLRPDPLAAPTTNWPAFVVAVTKAVINWMKIGWAIQKSKHIFMKFKWIHLYRFCDRPLESSALIIYYHYFLGSSTGLIALQCTREKQQNLRLFFWCIFPFLIPFYSPNIHKYRFVCCQLGPTIQINSICRRTYK